MDKINVAVIGCGYWGPNLIRNFNQLPDCQITGCCDLSAEKLKRMQSLYPTIKTSTCLDEIIDDASIDAVTIATPVYTHAAIAKKCLEHQKHVLLEKPMAASAAECLELIHLAEKNNLKLMVGHTFEYTAAVNKAKEIVESGELGEIYYISSERVNLGLFQPDINVIWDLAPHDLSIILYLMGEFPRAINSQGKAHFKPEIEDVATVTLNFANGGIAFLHLSWLDPCKIRRTTVVGSKKMLVYDDINTNEKIKIFDKGVDAPPYYDTFAEFHFSYRYGDIYTPRLNEYEPLRKECEHFLDCIKNNKTPRTDGYNGLRVVSILEAANQSLRNNGAQQMLNGENYYWHKAVA
ncbi:Gfo/Idh/MocA family oxidoreductase [candidate division KSB1 bacterium]|nr:Gfo/Idh/MocA family oxidoreductase [candidate division KSB1 bacterium]